MTTQPNEKDRRALGEKDIIQEGDILARGEISEITNPYWWGKIVKELLDQEGPGWQIYRPASPEAPEPPALRESRPEEIARDRIWCEALTKTLLADDILKVTSKFNQLRPDKPFGSLVTMEPPAPEAEKKILPRPIEMLKRLLEACELADVDDDLSEIVSGEILDQANAVLREAKNSMVGLELCDICIVAKNSSDWRGLCEEMAKVLWPMSALVDFAPSLPDCTLINTTMKAGEIRAATAVLAHFEKMTGKKP